MSDFSVYNIRFLQVELWFQVICYPESLVSMWPSSLSLLPCPCSRLATLGETLGRGSALLRTVPICQISSLYPELLGAAGPKLTTESTDKTAQNPVIPEKVHHTHTHSQIQTDTLACKHAVTWTCTRNTHRHMQARENGQTERRINPQNSHNKAMQDTNVL